MTQLKTTDSAQEKYVRIPRRDWILLPLFSFLTVIALAGTVHILATHMYSVSKTTVFSCLVVNDISTGSRAIPNTSCFDKSYESKLVEYKFNDCGHRTGMSCGSKPFGSFRIVMLGSSTGFGFRVQKEESFADLLPADISRRSVRPVELYNESMLDAFPGGVGLRLNQAFAAKPDMILWALTPLDIERSSGVFLPAPAPAPVPGLPSTTKSLKFPAVAWYRFKAGLATNHPLDAVLAIWSDGVSIFRSKPEGIMLQDLLYASRSLYLKTYLRGPEQAGTDFNIDFLRTESSARSREDLLQFDHDAAEVATRAKAEGIPFAVTLIPAYGQAAMISAGEWPQGFDPYKLDRELRSIIESHGGTFVDILPGFRTIPDPERYYFAVDGHPNAHGHAIISALLAKELTGGTVPALRSSAQLRAAVEKGR